MHSRTVVRLDAAQAAPCDLRDLGLPQHLPPRGAPSAME
jgi:hypothetical protein